MANNSIHAICILMWMYQINGLSYTDWPGVVRTHQGEPATLSWKLDTSLDDVSETVSFNYPPISGSSDAMYTRLTTGTETYHPDYQDRMTVSYTENNQRLGFTLDNVQENDTREEYECDVRVQGLRTINNNAMIFVYLPLSGPTLSPSPARPVESTTFILTCSATSTSQPAGLRPGLSYTWSREGGSLPDRHRVEGSEGERLVIDPVLREDHQKTYRCDVREIGSNLNKFVETDLDVQYEPGTPTLQAVDTQLVEGESLQLTCSHPAGNPAVYNYRWWNTDHSSVYTSTTDTRTFNNVTIPVHDGAWTCEVRNSVGASQSAQLRITVDAPPQIHDAPASRIEVFFNQTLSEVCQVKAKPRSTVSWTYNGGSTLPAAIQTQNIADSPSDKYTISGSTLQWSPEVSDSERRQAGGVYKCHGNNDVDPAISSHDINLIVLYGPVGITLSPPGPFTVIEGNEVTVTCNSDCSPTCNYTWTRSSDSWTHSGPELRFPDIQRTDHATYTCQSVNDYGSKWISAVITVNFGTEWKEFMTSPEELLHGNDVTLTCSVNSRPDSVVVISRALTELSRSVNSETDYKFHPISILDSDVYECSAGNGVGPNITDTEDLDVKGGFHFCEDQRESVSRGLPRSVDFEEQICQFANPFTDVSRSNWVFELLNETQSQTSLPTDVNITTAPTDHKYKKMIVFRIPEIKPEHYGTYKMTNGNEHGPDLVFIMFLTPEEPPEAPYGLTCTKTTSISLYLSWYAGYDGGPDQTFVLEYTNTATGDTYQVEIDGSEVLESELVSYKLVNETRVLPEQTYRIQISARNSKGLTTGPVITNTTMASLEIESSSPAIYIEDDKALITWEISNLEQVSHLTILACDSTDDTNCETTNVTEPLLQPYIVTLPPADNFVFLIVFYDGIHVLASAEEEHLTESAATSVIAIAVGVVVAVMVAVLIVVIVVLWLKGIILKTHPKQRKDVVLYENASANTVDQPDNLTVNGNDVQYEDIGKVSLFESSVGKLYEGLNEDKIFKGTTVYDSLQMDTSVEDFNSSNIVVGSIISEGPVFRIQRVTVKKAGITYGDAVRKIISYGEKRNADFLEEYLNSAAKILSAVKVCPHTIGCYSSKPDYMLMEYAPAGSLRQYLLTLTSQAYANTINSIHNECLGMLQQITSGLNVVFSLKPRPLFYCLSTDHVLMGTGQICKLTGFSSAGAVSKRESWEEENQLPRPIRWSAPEVIELRHVHESDIWAFGILVWEIFNLGERPLSNLTDKEAGERLKRGQKLKIANSFSQDLHDLMSLCWMYKPERRHTIAQITEMTKELTRVLHD